MPSASNKHGAEGNLDKLEARRKYRREWARKYRAAHLEECRAAEKRWREKNPNYQREWVAKNKERVRARYREWHARNYERNRVRERAWQKANAAKLRLACIAAFDGCCAHCGFTDERALEFDHIKGGGRKERGGTDRWKEILCDLAAAKQKFQLLCANCHRIKTREAGEFNPGKSKRQRSGRYSPSVQSRRRAASEGGRTSPVMEHE